MKKHLTLVLALLTILSTSVHAQLPFYLPADGLVGWWPFNGNANDESGNGNDGVVNGAELTEDRFGNTNSAYLFDSSYINVGNNPDLSITSNGFTVSAWANKSGDSNLWHILGKRNGGGEFQYQLSSNNLPFGLAWGGLTDGESSFIQTGMLINPNAWNHFVGTYHQNAWNLYLNGVLIGSLITPMTDYVNTNLLFGTAGSIDNSPYAGKIDDISIYNRALTEQEIQNLYTATNTGNTVDTGDGAAPLPQGIPYQAAARDANGQPVVDSPVNVRFSLHEGAADGATSYIESHNLTTNSIGLFNTVFGNGTPEQSAFDSINWAATTKFLQVEVDLGNGYLDMGTTHLLSVPYAFRSAQAANIKNAALPVYPDNTAALAGGLVAGEMYRTVTGDLKVVY